MKTDLTRQALLTVGLSGPRAAELLERIGNIPGGEAPFQAWTELSKSFLRPDDPFAVHLLVHREVFRNHDPSQGPPPAWTPAPPEIEAANIRRFCDTYGIEPLESFHAWSADHRERFWSCVIETLGIAFRTPPKSIRDPEGEPESPRWLPGAMLNIADSCFRHGENEVAVVYQPEAGGMKRLTFGELDRLTKRFANSLRNIGVGRGEAVAIAMPMTVEAIVAYLGIVRSGCAVVSIADSFAADEIATRLRIAGARLVVTRDVVHRAGKTLPMYRKVVDAGAEATIVVVADRTLSIELRGVDHGWDEFLVKDESFASVACEPDDTINILFSSGTTGEPKAIPWSHSTAIKCAMDGHLHHDIHPGEVVVWPTNIGWMMGPWLIFASLINRATIGLHHGAPNTVDFCRFVQEAGVRMLGVVPGLVRAWRSGGMIDGLDWTGVRRFSSTGEASNAEDMLWLMSRAGYRPVIEYCGGTEIGGGYITGSVVRPASPATFSTPAFGLDFQIVDEAGKAADNGELFLVPPSIGLSNRLLNRDHHQVYFNGTPPGPNGELLRRHGDQMERLPGGYYRALGRADDTMNLAGIKISSAEIERTVASVEEVREIAAIAVPSPGGGPDRLVIFAVLYAGKDQEPEALKNKMQGMIRSHLNPLFRIHDVVVIDDLPRTASNKIMRRVLRNRYESR
jgi:acetyl-CoA synthetase